MKITCAKKQNILLSESQWIAHNNMLVREQVGGNCTCASLNTMMCYLVLRKYEALRESISNEEGQAASHAARMLNFYCRMKSMEAAFDKFSTNDASLSQDELAQRIRFLERIFEAKICYFQKT
jgi:hypothetical protein